MVYIKSTMTIPYVYIKCPLLNSKGLSCPTLYWLFPNCTAGQYNVDTVDSNSYSYNKQYINNVSDILSEPVVLIAS